MPDSLTIPKSTSSFPQYLDWSLLRAAGIKHIEELGSDLWTDYNLHDPGITILEVLCYALTDLGYRTNFDIKDLLTRSHSAKNSEKKTIFGLPGDDNFFTAAEVLSCNPVTINDFRKLLLDIPGIRNAWLEPAPEGEMAIYLNRKKKRLQFELPVNGNEELDRISLRGLYDICLELEPLLVRDACGSVFFSNEGIINTVHERLYAHRNLCEDFRDIMVFGDEQIAVCADIELAATAIPENVLLEIYKQVEDFLSPTLSFYTLQEMLQKGKRVEDIFEGRPLSAQSHGFIDTEDLKKLDPKHQIYASDLYRVIMGVEGVVAIHNLSMANAINDVAQTEGEKWCLELTPRYRPHFDLGRSRITFFKGVLPFTTDKTVVGQRYLEEKAARLKALLDPYQLDLPIPEGRHADLEDYLSIMEDFPLTYGIGEEGIKGSPDAQRKGQAKQLKGYLLFFDQLLANYLSQLAHLRDLFSMRPDKERNGKDHIYFTQLLKEVPGIGDLVKNFRECEGNDTDEGPPEDFPSYLRYIAESTETYQDRRNRFLDHLLARFSESFSDYVLLMFEINGKQQEWPKIIQDKADFLQSYPEISRNRGKGFDYSQPVGCEDDDECGEVEEPVTEENNQPGNVSGLEKRVSKLIGLDETGWRSYALCNVRKIDAGWGFSIKKEGAAVLDSKTVWATEEEACQSLVTWIGYFGDEKFYRRLNYELAGDAENEAGSPVKFEYSFLLVNEAEKCIAISSSRYDDPEKREEVIHWLISQVRLPGMECTAVMETECYEFQLFDQTGEKLLFRSKPGFQAEQDAKDFFDLPEDDDDFMGWAVKPANYEKTEKDGLFSFYLKNNLGERVALHPHEYATDQERSDRLQAIIYYLDDVPPVTSVDGTPGTFEFEITDAAGNKLFISTHTYPTQKEATTASWLVRLLARHRVYYRLLENPGSELPFGFELLDRNGDPIALHPHRYATDCERDLAVDVIIYCSENIDTVHRIAEKNDGFYFELDNPDGTPLMAGLIGFPDANAAEAAWENFIDRAMNKDNYRPTLIEGAEYPLGFEMLDAGGIAIASSVLSYATVAESEMALRAVLNYVCHTEWFVELTGDPGSYHFWLDSTDGKRLLDSVVVYPDEPSARFALQSVLQLAQVPANFFALDNFGFELRNAEGSNVANHPHLYTSETERDAAINLIVSYVRTDELKTDILNIGGAFQAIIFDENNEVVFKGEKYHPNAKTAGAELEQLFLFAAYPENYQPVEDGHERCRFGFRLLDNDGKVVALHPLKYPSAGERDKAMMSVFAWLTRGELLTDRVITSGEKYSFVLKDFPGKDILQGKYEYDTAATAREIWLLVVEAANIQSNFIITYDNSRCLYTVELLVNGLVMAIPPGPFISRKAAREWIALVTHILQTDPVWGEANGTDCGYYYLLEHTWHDESDGGNEKTTGLKGVQHYPLPSGALKACHESASLLSSAELFKVEASDDKWRLTLENESGEQEAYSTSDYDEETKAIEDRDRIQASLSAPVDLNCENAERVSANLRESAFYSQVSHEDTVLLESLPLETIDDAWNNSDAIHELSQDIKRYNLITNHEECLFSFELTDYHGVAIATHPVFYATIHERDEAILKIMELVNSEGMHLVEHILLRPLRKGTGQSYYFELLDNQQKYTLLQSPGNFMAESEAWEALLQMWVSIWRHGKGETGYIELINDSEGLCKYSFKIMSGPEDDEEEGGPSQLLAMPVGPCHSAEDRDTLLESLGNIVKDLEEAPAELPVLPKPYQVFVNPFRLEDEVDGCQLMTPVLDHLVPGEKYPPFHSDPYSFRGTVVLPYWPERFQKPEFRAFVETTLRQEAPAHVFLRICWVNPRQMKEFEEAYCHWLATKNGGEDACGASAAKNRLIDILCSLRSIYPAASLHDCNQPSNDSNRVVLNYSIIGSANTSSHGK